MFIVTCCISFKYLCQHFTIFLLRTKTGVLQVNQFLMRTVDASALGNPLILDIPLFLLSSVKQTRIHLSGTNLYQTYNLISQT